MKTKTDHIKRAMYYSLALLALVVLQFYLYDLGAQIFSSIFAGLCGLLFLELRFFLEA